jgi:CheY-like chemotaxis protein/Tfp pilus assembly protein PilZ
MSQNPRILLVDDEKDIREILRDDLDGQGYEIFEAGSGNEAIALLDTQKFDLVISDLKMPNGDGMALLKMIKERHPTLPTVMFVTAYATVSREEAHGLGAEAVVLKPWNPTVLLAHVRNLLKPLKERWSHNQDRIPLEENVMVGVPGVLGSTHVKTVNVGRGGMFLQMEGELPQPGDCIEFQFDETAQKLKISGKALVRWRRDTASLAKPKGIGVEFIEISEDHRSQVIDFIAQVTSTPYIPTAN